MDDSPSAGVASNGPYRHAAGQYFHFGWQPIPLRGKVLAPTWNNNRFLSITGRGGVWLDAETIKRLIARYGDHNIGIRLPDGVIGIDVDAYRKDKAPAVGKGKKSKKVDKQAAKQAAKQELASRGDATLRDLEKEYGPLPPAPVSSARGRPDRYGSGIRLYRVPLGLEFAGKLGPGIETIQWWHRYVAVAPSIHPLTGTAYQWYPPAGESIEDGEVYLPSLEEIPKLPKRWLEALSRKYQAPARSSGGYVKDADVEKWIMRLDELNQPAGDKGSGLPAMCSQMKTVATEGAAYMAQRGADGAHDEMRDRQWMILRDALSGHQGLAAGLVMLRSAFLGEVEERRQGGRDGASTEWGRALRGAVSKLIDGGLGTKNLRAVVDAQGGQDICAVFAEGNSTKAGLIEAANAAATDLGGSSGFDYERTDIGNSQRLGRAVQGRAVYVPDWESWVFYDDSTSMWSRDKDNARITREMIRVVQGMNAEAAYIDDTDQRKAFKTWVKASGARDRLRAAIYLAEKSASLIGSPAHFDANGSSMVVRLLSDIERYSVLSLSHNGFTERPLMFEDRATLSTGATWRGLDARSKLWDSFLAKIQPDKMIRDYLQAIIGASLVDGNPLRSFIMLQGETTSGKSTFLDAIASALGKGYARTFNMSMFREKYNHGGRPDIVSVLYTRFIYATESSSEWKLHADAVKRLAGGDVIGARNLYSNEFVERKPAFTPFLATNAIPQIQGADVALWRRLIVIPFDTMMSPDEIDINLPAKLSEPEHSSAILAWAVRGWIKAMRSDGIFRAGLFAGAPVPVLRRTADAKDLMSDVDSFLAWACVRDSDAKTLTRDLYDAYRVWSEIYGEEGRGIGINAFGQLLTGKGLPAIRDRDDEGHQGRYRVGIRIK